MNPEAQTIFNGILAKLSRDESLADHERSFLRARRGYLTRWQRVKYGDILYFNKQFLFHQKMGKVAMLLARSAKEIILALLIGLLEKLPKLIFMSLISLLELIKSVRKRYNWVI